MGWQDISTAPENISRCLVWCSDLSMDYDTGLKAPVGTKFGRRIDGRTYGEGMSGDWTFTHWQPLPPPPTEDAE